jgi:hypothetical protein
MLDTVRERAGRDNMSLFSMFAGQTNKSLSLKCEPEPENDSQTIIISGIYGGSFNADCVQGRANHTTV